MTLHMACGCYVYLCGQELSHSTSSGGYNAFFSFTVESNRCGCAVGCAVGWGKWIKNSDIKKRFFKMANPRNHHLRFRISVMAEACLKVSPVTGCRVGWISLCRRVG